MAGRGGAGHGRLSRADHHAPLLSASCRRRAGSGSRRGLPRRQPKGRCPSARRSSVTRACIAEIELTERLLPKGPLGDRPADGTPRVPRRAALRARLRSRRPTRAARRGSPLVAVQRSNFLPGTLERVYGASGPLPKLTAAIAVKEHFADRLEVHPSTIEVGDGEATCGDDARPALSVHAEARAGRGAGDVGGDVIGTRRYRSRRGREVCSYPAACPARNRAMMAVSAGLISAGQ